MTTRQLILDGSFEQNSAAWTYSPLGFGLAGRVLTPTHAGTASCMLERRQVIDSPPPFLYLGGAVRQNLNLTVDAPTSLSLWMNGTFNTNAELAFYLDYSFVGSLVEIARTAVPPGWNQWFVPAFAPFGQLARLQLQAVGLIPGASTEVGIIYIDEVSITQPDFIYTPIMRIVPVDGPEVQYTLTPMSNVVKYEYEHVLRTSVNYNEIDAPFGFRPTIDMKFEITNLADEAALAAVASALVNDNYRVFLSQYQGVEREVMLSTAYIRRPLANRTLAGVAVEMRLVATELIRAPQGLTPIGTVW